MFYPTIIFRGPGSSDLLCFIPHSGRWLKLGGVLGAGYRGVAKNGDRFLAIPEYSAPRRDLLRPTASLGGG